MGKQTHEQKGKLMIARDKSCDADFDRLVMDTSHSVARKSSLDDVLSLSPETRAVRLTSGSPAAPLNQPYDQVGTSCDHVATSTTTINISTNHQDRSNQPKRPMNAFMVWGQAIRRELHHKFSNVQNALLSKALGRVWRSLDPAEKEPFVRRANMIKANHKRDYPNYRYQPRRVQERRAKSNMLIGINLNHPVNQLQCQQTTYSPSLDHQIATTEGTNSHLLQFAPHNSSGCHGGQLVVSEDGGGRKLLMSSNWRRNLTTEPRARDLSKETIDGLQTFEYHPYPSAAPAGSEITTIECNNCRPATTNNGYQNVEANCREGQHQTSIYPPYQQVTYSSTNQQHHQHHHHHHHQQQPQQYYNGNNQQLPQQQAFSYDVTQLQSNHMDSCHGVSLKSINNSTELYYGSK